MACMQAPDLIRYGMAKSDVSKTKTPEKNEPQVQRVSDSRFSKDLDALIQESEDMRLTRMKQHRMREFIAMNVTILSFMAGIGAFGWYFLMEAQLTQAFTFLGLSFIPPIFSHIWSGGPLKRYVREHKSVFLPKLAKTLGGLDFYPKRGVSAKFIEKLAVIPAHDRYEAEDCFMGVYKGVKVIFSEARLYSKAHRQGPVFEGIFVLLENEQEVFDGHTVICANPKMIKAYKDTRWRTMQEVHISVSEPEWDKFRVFSTKADSAELLVGEKLIKELAEAAQIFDNAPLTAVMAQKKYLFMMIPNKHDMFEASSLFVPVTTKSQALKCKKEIEQLLEIIDVFDLYKPMKT